MNNTPFSNTFKATFRAVKKGALVVSQRLTLTPDHSMIIRDATDKIIKADQLTPGDLLEVYVSSSEPYAILSVRVLPVSKVPTQPEK